MLWELRWGFSGEIRVGINKNDVIKVMDICFYDKC